MYLIAGLGNPEKKYDGTRHNAGFAAVEKLAEKLNVSLTEKKFQGVYGKGSYAGEKLLLLKPLTYMNRSGDSLRAAADYFQIAPEQIIVLYDDINFACGKLRVRASGSAGGHNGIKSIIANLDTEGFPRVRIGVGGLSEHGDMISHVLGHFDKKDREIMERAYEGAAEAALCILEHGAAEAMNRFNGRDFAKEA